MRVAVETQFAIGTPTGLGVYARNLYAALNQTAGIEAVALEDPRFDLWRFDRRVYWDQIRAPMLANRARADVVHFTGGTVPALLPRRAVVTVHDLVWRRRANRGRPYVHWYFGDMQRVLVRRAAGIVVDTNAARDDVSDGLDVAPDRIFVAGAGVDQRFFEVVRNPDVSPPFILAVGTIEERKDLITAVRAIASLSSEAVLVAAGPHTPYAESVAREAERLGVSSRVRLLGYVDDAHLLDLYSRASAFVFPTRYEGFGLPPLQACAAGLPVVASDIPVVREVLGPSVRYCEPGDDRAFGAALAAALAAPDDGLAQISAAREHARTFTWASVAQRLAGFYRGLF
jgi:glycosyltransferase involved in cell wall biosynthesis